MIEPGQISEQQNDWLEEQELRHEWRGQFRPWRFGEPCPAQVRDRLAPEWRHFDATGQPYFVRSES